LVKGAPLETIKRIRAPTELTGEQKKEFCRVVDTLPADWFIPAHIAGLVQYCRHVVMARRVAKLIDDYMSRPDFDPMKVVELVKRQECESRAITKLMTMLRITPQSVALSRESPKRLRQEAQTPWSGSDEE
jgi:hypothetical protein